MVLLKGVCILMHPFKSIQAERGWGDMSPQTHRGMCSLLVQVGQAVCTFSQWSHQGGCSPTESVKKTPMGMVVLRRAPVWSGWWMLCSGGPVWCMGGGRARAGGVVARCGMDRQPGKVRPGSPPYLHASSVHYFVPRTCLRLDTLKL